MPVPAATDVSRRSFGIEMIVDVLRQFPQSLLRLQLALAAFEPERLGHHRHCQRAELVGQAGDDGRGPVPVPPPSPVVTNTMSRAGQHSSSLSALERAARLILAGPAPSPW